jgi:F-type H+-transporting ATPase subunit gamma
MPGTKEIRSKISSIKNTQKITKAMEMVAASKMRRAQDRMRASRPYAEKIRQVIGHLSEANPDYRHPFLASREEVKSIGIIVISTDRGLAGGLNVNLFKNVLYLMRDWQAKGAETKLAWRFSAGWPRPSWRTSRASVIVRMCGISSAPSKSCSMPIATARLIGSSW